MKKISILFIAIAIISSCGQRDSSEMLDYLAKENKEMKGAYATDAVVSGLGIVNRATLNDGEIGNNFSGKKAQQGGMENQKSAIVAKKIPAKIRKTAYLDINVDDYKKAHQMIEKIVEGVGGYIASEDEQNSTYSIYNTMVIRVLNKDFDKTVNNVSGIASHVNSKNITAEDVTAQFVDIESRLKSKKEIEKRYLAILQKASKVKDILEVEQNLGYIREEIEAKEGELKYLDDQVEYSTISLTFQQNFEYNPVDKPGFSGRVGSAFGNGWNGFLSFVVGLVYIWPALLIIGVVAFFLVRFIRKQVKK